MKTVPEVLNKWYLTLPEASRQISLPDRSRLERNIKDLLADERTRLIKFLAVEADEMKADQPTAGREFGFLIQAEALLRKLMTKCAQSH